MKRADGGGTSPRAAASSARTGQPRQMFGQGRQDQGFRLLVGLRHGACVRFQPRFAAPCVNLHDDSAGFDAKSREEFGQPVAQGIVECCAEGEGRSADRVIAECRFGGMRVARLA